MNIPHLLGRFVGTDIRSEREAWRFVRRIAFFSILVAVGFDVLNQSIFFENWEAALRSWVISAAVAAVISVPVGLSIARAYLALYLAKEDVVELSRRDPLTGLLNRRALLEDDASLAALMVLVIVDIDRFKSVNDAHGHLIGDEVIRFVARSMQEELGELGPVGRLGGEEFALLSLEEDPSRLMGKLWDLRDRVAATPIIVGGEAVRVTISAGVARREDGQSFADLYRAADQALYLAKATGRNEIILHSPLASFVRSGSVAPSGGTMDGGERRQIGPHRPR